MATSGNPGGSKIIECTCRHSFQDERYGSGKRLHNRMEGKDIIKHRCTVCANVVQKKA